MIRGRMIWRMIVRLDLVVGGWVGLVGWEGWEVGWISAICLVLRVEWEVWEGWEGWEEWAASLEEVPALEEEAAREVDGGDLLLASALDEDERRGRRDVASVIDELSDGRREKKAHT